MDRAGNVVKLLLASTLASASALAFAGGPNVPGTPDLLASADTGQSSTDNVTAVQSPDFSGTCTDGDTITLQSDGVALSPTVVCSGGAYTVNVQDVLLDGQHAITATETLGGVTTLPSAALSVTIDTMPPGVTINSGPTGTGNGTSATFTFTVGEGAPTDCALDANPFASCSSPISYSGLSAGPHTISVRATDVAGNVSLATRGWSVGGPPAPSAPMLDIASDSGRFDNDNVTNADPLTFIGTCTNGDAIQLYIDDARATPGPTTCASGGYQITVFNVQESSRTVTVTATRAGLEGAQSAPLHVEVDRTAPAAPEITSPSGTTGGYTMVSGVGEPTTWVTVAENGDVRCMAIVTAAGTWSCKAKFTSSGPHNVVAFATDLAGNIGQVSTPYALDIDVIFADGFDDPTPP